MADVITVFCLQSGEAASHAFSVEIDPTKTVDYLRKLIKAEKTNDFSDIDADKLTLWRVTIPISDDNDDIPILLDNVINKDKKKLGPATRLSKAFPEDLPDESIHIIVQRPPSATDPNARTSFDVRIEGHIPASLKWQTIPAEASLADLHDQIRVKCGVTDSERRLITIVHPKSFSQDPEDKDVQEPRLRNILKMYVQEGLKELVLYVDFPQKGFSKFSLADLLRRLGVKEFESFPVGTTLCDTEERREVLEKLKGAIDLARRSSKFVNEACTTRYVGPYFQAAVALNPELCLTPEREISGRWGNGPVDYGIESRNAAGLYVVGVTEVKTTTTLPSGFPQNAIQLDAALTGCDERGPRSQSRSLVAYGVVTDAKHWEFIECRVEPMNASGTFQPPPIIRRQALEVQVDYDKEDWCDNVQKVFEHVLWFVEKMSVGIPLIEDAPVTKRIREDAGEDDEIIRELNVGEP
ncbi:hypothetical protein BGX33_009961 [Mortierella sp. NVP41]|nr:hypothetical protein BGX33_009961 [Mortierella sp. NVP41]